MEAKKYLKRAMNIEKRIKVKQEEIKKWRELGENITPKLKDIVNKSSDVSDKVGESAINILKIQEDLKGDIEELAEVYIDIKNMINKLDNEQEKVLLEYRYLNGKSWQEISLLMGYSERSIFRLHGIALLKLNKLAVNVSKLQ